MVINYVGYIIIDVILVSCNLILNPLFLAVYIAILTRGLTVRTT